MDLGKVGMAGWMVIALLVGTGPPASVADVTGSSDWGFAVELAVDVAAPPDEAFRVFVEEIDRWWDPAHTFGGDAAGLSIEPRAGGCFCEALPDSGGVRHLEVVHVAPGRLIRLQGGLGPLQAAGVTGSLGVAFDRSEAGTEVRLTYTVGGYVPGGLQVWADPVDRMLEEQLARYRDHVAASAPGSL